MATRAIIEGNPVLVVIDIQGGESSDDETPSTTPFMPGYQDRMDNAPALIDLFAAM